MKPGPAPPPLRIAAGLSKALKDRFLAGLDALAARARSLSPFRGEVLAAETTMLVDELVTLVAGAALEALGRRDGAAAVEEARRVGLVALGGYGRRELCPHSDVDLLFLLPAGQSGESGPLASYTDAVLYGLWDLGFEVGHAVRTVNECEKVAEADHSVLTGMLDARLLLGASQGSEVRDAEFARLSSLVDKDLLAGPRAAAFVEQKLEEAKRRRSRFGTSVFLLEPNVKESDGGIRELHTALWIARARWRARKIGDLLRQGIVSPREGTALERAYGFLLRVRAELHLAAKRRQDVLGFAYQELVAARLGYFVDGELDHDKKTHGVERFMRAYYFHARNLRHHSAMLLERAVQPAGKRNLYLQKTPGDFKVWQETLTVSDRDQFERDPAAIVRIFRIAQEEALPIYSYTKDLIAESKERIGAVERRRAEVVRDFLAILEDPKADGAILDDMHDLGVLRRIIPEVSRITARWQHSQYHVYTVDAHSIFVVKNLKRLKSGDAADEQPELSKLMADLPRPQVLYMAGFLHDIGKGWPRGDHSKRGADVAQVVGGRFEAAGLASWTKEETADAVWLVREHLTMSDISQRRDLGDRDLIRSFARDVRTRERLDMLYLLTYADMKSTSPKVWTDWKGSLLAELYERTRVELELGQTPAAGDPHLEARRQLATQEVVAEALERKAPIDEGLIRAFTTAMPARYLLSFRPRQMIRHIQMWRDISNRGGFATHVRQLRREDITKLTIVCPDRPGLLSILAGTLAANRLQILSAQIFSVDLLPVGEPSAGPQPEGDELAYDLVAATGRGAGASRAALDVIFVKDDAGHIADDPGRWERVREDLRATIMGASEVSELVRTRLPRSSLSARPRPAVKTEIKVSNADSRSETVVDVFCQDQLGVLYTVARAFSEQGLSISLAKISTQGDRVADGFYVTDAATGAKVEDPARIEALKKALKDALA